MGHKYQVVQLGLGIAECHIGELGRVIILPTKNGSQISGSRIGFAQCRVLYWQIMWGNNIASLDCPLKPGHTDGVMLAIWRF